MERKIKFAKEFLEFVKKSPSVYHSAQELEETFIKNKYEKLELGKPWDLELNKGYYVKRGDSAIIGIKIPKKLKKEFFKITINHLDTPGFKIKPNPVTEREGYLRFNTEVYGGPILNTWLDRPLGVAGRVLVKGETILTPKTELFSIDRPLMVIPNVAIHQNQGVNDGIKLSKQNDMLPLVSIVNKEINNSDLLLDLIEEKLKISRSEILDCELYLYEIGEGVIFGASNEFINCGKIDNLASAFAGINAFIDSSFDNGINVIGCFDHEECGSLSIQGGGTRLLYNVLERVALEFAIEKCRFSQMIYNSFIISVDGAHSVHPAKGEKTDITNRPRINNGVVIKHSSNKSYATDGFSSAVIKALAQENEIKIQNFINHSDERGGSTLGPITLGNIDANCIDLGIPMLSMHSVRETAGVEDLYELKKLLQSFYSLNK